MARALHQNIIADSNDMFVNVLEVAGDGDLFNRILDLAMFDPETRRTARIVAGHRIDAVSEQFGDQ